MYHVKKYQGNQVDICHGKTCVKTKGPAADVLSGIVIGTAFVAGIALITRLVR